MPLHLYWLSLLAVMLPSSLKAVFTRYQLWVAVACGFGQEVESHLRVDEMTQQVEDLVPSMMTSVQSLETIGWKEKTDSHTLSCTSMHMHTHS